MACCDHHDRMDSILTSLAFNDAACGTPTNPSGEERYCCRQCPSKGQPLALKAVWVANPKLMAYLSAEEQAQVHELARVAGLPVDEMVAGAVAPDA